MRLLDELAEHRLLVQVPVYGHYNGLLRDRVDLEAQVWHRYFAGWTLCPLWRFREGRIRGEYGVHLVDASVRAAFEDLTQSVLELDDGQLVALGRSRAVDRKFLTYDLLELTRTFRLWRDEWALSP